MKLINPNKFKRGKPLTKKELLNLNISDICFVKFWDDGGRLRGNEYQFVYDIDENQTIFLLILLDQYFH